MTAPRQTAPSIPIVAAQVAAVAMGAAVLVLRPLISGRVGWTATTVAGLFTGLLAVSLAVPVPAPGSGERRRPPVWLIVGLIGVATFALARLFGGGHAPAPLTARVIGLNSLAAVAEEALFRRLTYGALQAGGTAWAVGGSALLFGLVHVTVYGWWAFPVDLAAGLILSWQRLASGTWTVPAITHVLADLLVVI
jgi:membrane protease YdiL (CAAX protease family)